MKKNIETIKSNQSETKNSISEMKNKLEGINGRLDEAEDLISNLENKIAEYTASQQKKEKRVFFKNEGRLRVLWDNMKQTSIHIIKVPAGEKSEQGIKSLFEEIMTENFPKLVKENNKQI